MSDEMFVAIADAQLEFMKKTDGTRIEARSSASGAVNLDLPAGEYEVALAHPNFGSKISTIIVSADMQPHQFRLLSKALVGYIWPKWSRSGEDGEIRFSAHQAVEISLWRYGWEKEFIRDIGRFAASAPSGDSQTLPDGDVSKIGVKWNHERFDYAPDLEALSVTAPEKSGLYYFHMKTSSGETFSFPWIVAPGKKANEKEISTYNTYGYYFGKLTVSALDENQVILLGFNCLYSDNGGKSFIVKDKTNTHPDWHTLWINPNRDGHWVAGHDGGCNITYDYGKHWFKVINNAVGQFYNITTDDAKPYNVYGGLQDNGTWFGNSKLNVQFDADEEKEDEADAYNWKSIGGGDGMQVHVDSRDNKTVYSGYQFGFYNRRSTDGGRGVSIHPMHDLSEQKLRYNWQTPIWLSKHGPDVFYYGSNKFHRSLNKGEKLETLSGDLTNGKKEGKIPFGTLTTIVESSLKFGLVYVGSDDGNINVTKDGGYTFTTISKTLPTNVPQGLYVSRVMPSQYKEGRVYVTLNGYRHDNFMPYLLVSENFGATWQQLGLDLPAEPLNVVKEDPKNENIIYIGTDNGVYASFDMGKTFMGMFGKNLPRVPVHDIAIQQRDNEIIIGTHGRSIYVAKLDEVQKAYTNFIK